MNSTDLIDLVLSGDRVSFVITGPWAQRTTVELALPDLRSARRACWGDWGPMYKVSVPPDRPIGMRVHAPDGGPSIAQTLDLTEVRVESPILASTREQTPLVMTLPLVDHGVCVSIYFDHQGQAVHTEAAPLMTSGAMSGASAITRCISQSVDSFPDSSIILAIRLAVSSSGDSSSSL